VRDFQRSHKAERINASLKPHEALPKTLLDQEPDPRPQGNDVPPAGGQAVRAPDEVQAGQPFITEREAGPTVGMASVNRAADDAQNTPPLIIERKGTAISRSLVPLSVVMVMVVMALGLIKFLFRRTYAKRVLAFAAMRLSQRPPDYVGRVDLSWPLRNQIEADPGAASSQESVKKALDSIEEAVVEMAFSRQLGSSL
jgi:flagellar biosynthesis/type III secretory pathway M-ring protein FliF/YscJ